MLKRKERQKGEIVEKKFIDWLNKYNILFWYITQDIETYSKALKLTGIKRPDFVIFLGKGNIIFVDAKYNKPARKYETFYIDAKEVEKYSKLENISNIKTWLALSNEEYHYTIWHWIPIRKILEQKLYFRKKSKGSYYSVPLSEFEVVINRKDFERIIKSQERLRKYSLKKLKKFYLKV